MASLNGHKNIVKLLLSHSEIKVNEKDIKVAKTDAIKTLLQAYAEEIKNMTNENTKNDVESENPAKVEVDANGGAESENLISNLKESNSDAISSFKSTLLPFFVLAFIEVINLSNLIN